MRDFLHFQAKRTEITIMIICVLVGFLLVTQLLGQAQVSHDLASQSEQDLGQIIHELNTETSSMQQEVSDLKIKLYRYQQQLANKKAILASANNNLKDLRVIAGLSKVKGPGLKLTITDRGNTLDTFDFLDIVQELRVAGAEAISINGIRVVADTSFTKRKRTVYINNNRKISSPFAIEAIGEPETLYQAVGLGGGLKDKLSSLEKVDFKMAKETTLVLPPASNE